MGVTCYSQSMMTACIPMSAFTFIIILFLYFIVSCIVRNNLIHFHGGTVGAIEG